MIDDGSILALLARARDLGAQPVVHAENNAAIEWLTGELRRSGRTALRFNGVAKPVAAEREAIHRILTYAELVGVAVHVFHVTSAQAVEEIERAQRRGVHATGETCPQYLYFTEADLDRPLEEAAKFIFGPPPRTAADQEALWAAIRRGTIDVISSDHAPYPYSGPAGKIAGARHGGFANTPHGIPGLETFMTLAYSAGVAGGRIDINEFVALTATNPAKRFGLHPQKGSISVGADADLVLWDPDRIRTIRNADLHHLVEYSPYEGLSVRGAPRATVSRGEIIVRDGRAAAQPGRGRLIARKAVARGVDPGSAA
jgi:dihydropyrimidinase